MLAVGCSFKKAAHLSVPVLRVLTRCPSLGQGAHILVFPEDGLQGFNYSRSSIRSFLETIPDPRQESWNPCTEPRRHNSTEVRNFPGLRRTTQKPFFLEADWFRFWPVFRQVLQRLSCMAHRHGLYLVANMAGRQPCPLSSAPGRCPPDGQWHFNTNVVFRSDRQSVNLSF